MIKSLSATAHLYAFLYVLYATCPAHPILPNFTTPNVTYFYDVSRCSLVKEMSGVSEESSFFFAKVKKNMKPLDGVTFQKTVLLTVTAVSNPGLTHTYN
jgi:hypothetical protein